MSKGRFSSFVQMRGSVPAHWSQDVSKMVPKPTIICDLSDPYVETAGINIENQQINFIFINIRLLFIYI